MTRILGIDPGSQRTGVGIIDVDAAGRATHVFHAPLLLLGEGGFPDRLKRLDVRFSSPVFPGETIKVEVWRDGADDDKGRAAFRATVRERDEIVLNNGYAEFA